MIPSSSSRSSYSSRRESSSRQSKIEKEKSYNQGLAQTGFKRNTPEQISSSLYVGGQPNEDGYKKLQEMGIKTVVSFRAPSDKFKSNLPNISQEAELASNHGMKFVNIPMEDKTPASKQQRDEFLSVATSSESGKTYAHCHAGKNRTGFITSVYGMEVLDWDYDKARDNMTGRGHKPERHQDMHDELKSIYESKKAGKSKT